MKFEKKKFCASNLLQVDLEAKYWILLKDYFRLEEEESQWFVSFQNHPLIHSELIQKSNQQWWDYSHGPFKWYFHRDQKFVSKKKGAITFNSSFQFKHHTHILGAIEEQRYEVTFES